MADNRYLKSSSEPPAEAQKEAIKPIAKASTKKKGFLRKTKEFLFCGDTKDVKDYIVEETIKPAIRDGIYDVFMNFVEGMIYGDQATGRRRRRGSSSKGKNYEKTSYTSYYKTSNKYEDDRKERRSSGRERIDLDYIEFVDPDLSQRENYEKAIEVKAGMVARIERYSTGASVQDVYDFCGISCPDWNATEWGWTDADEFEKGAYIKKVRGGAVLSLPPPSPLND